jgi:phosphonate transport system substrate-binding protein
MKRLIRPLGAVVLAALVSVAAACGGSDDTSEATNATAAAPGREAAASAAADPRAGWPKKFRVGFFGGDDAEALLEKQDPLKQYLESRLGMPVELFTGTSYGAVIEAMRADRVDAMLVGPFAYVLAVQEANAEAIAVSVSTTAKEPKYDPELKPFYFSVVFTKKGNGIATLNDLRGKGFNFVDPASASGHLAPKTLLIKNGIDPDKDLKSVFAGSHPTSVISVWNDKAPAGGTNENNLVRLADSGQVQWCPYPDGKINKQRTAAEIRAVYDACPNGKIVVLAQTDPIPNTPFAVRKALPESFKAEVKKALLDIKNQPQIIAKTSNWYVDPTEELKLANLDQSFNSLRDIAKLLNLNLKELE